MNLSNQNFNKAVNFIKTHARPLEQQLYAHQFEGGSVEAVIGALAKYQNADGGFGNAIESDFRLAESSPLATTVGLQIIRKLGVDSNEPIVQRAINYLLDTFDQERGYWQAVSKAVNDVPHAPWWTFDEKSAPETPANPTAEIVGYLHAYASLVPNDFLKAVTEPVIHYLEANQESMAMFDLHCYQRMLDMVSDDLASHMRPMVEAAISRVIVSDASKWEEYVAQPLEFITAPDEPLYVLFQKSVEANLNFTLQHQLEDGSWQPKWTWGDQYPDVWPIAKQEWAGVITLNTLGIMHRFGKIERSIS